MAQTASSKTIGSLQSTTLGVSIGLVGTFITVLSSSIHSRWVAQDAEANLYGFPLPWLSKSLGFTASFEDFLNQARSPPVVNYPAFALDFLFYTAPLLALTYLLVGAASRHRVWRLPPTLMSSGSLLYLAGLLSVLLGMIFVLASLSNMMTLAWYDGHVDRYGSPLPWLSKRFGYAVIDTEGLLSQIRAPPIVDYQALLADVAFYLLPSSAVVYGTVGLIHTSQYLARRLLRPRTRESLRHPETRRLASTLGPPGLSFPSGYTS